MRVEFSEFATGVLATLGTLLCIVVFAVLWSFIMFGTGGEPWLTVKEVIAHFFKKGKKEV